MHSCCDVVWSGGEWTGQPIMILLHTCTQAAILMSQEACHQYWPSTAGKQHYGDLLVERTQQNKYDGYTERVLSITDKVCACKFVLLLMCILMIHTCSLARFNIR